MLRAHTGQRGDTLIEVMLAFSIFSAIVIGAFIIMNQGISSAQNSLEINLVRNQIDTQAELLRHLNNGKLTSVGRAANDQATEWNRAVALAQPRATPYSNIEQVDDCKEENLPNNSFFINPKTGMVVAKSENATLFRDTQTFAQVQPASPAPNEPVMVSNMIWIEAVSSPNDTLRETRYYDFHIRACWEAPGAGAGLLKLGTIVRLYVPNE